MEGLFWRIGRWRSLADCFANIRTTRAPFPRGLIGLIVLAMGLAFPLSAHSQAGSTSVVGTVAAEEGLSLLTPDQIPSIGTFWLVTSTSSGPPMPLPCLPLGYTGFNIYAITDGAYLVDETTNDASTMSADAIATQATPILNLINVVQNAGSSPLRAGMGMNARSAAG